MPQNKMPSHIDVIVIENPTQRYLALCLFSFPLFSVSFLKRSDSRLHADAPTLAAEGWGERLGEIVRRT